MKISTDKIRKMAHSVIRGSKHYGEHYMMFPVRDWYLGIGFFFVMGLLGAYWAAATFMQHKTTVEYQGDSSAEVTVYKKVTVSAALKELEERKAQYEMLEQRLTAGADITKEIVVEVPVVATSTPVTDEMVPESSSGVQPAL